MEPSLAINRTCSPLLSQDLLPKFNEAESLQYDAIPHHHIIDIEEYDELAPDVANELHREDRRRGRNEEEFPERNYFSKGPDYFLCKFSSLSIEIENAPGN